MILSVINAPPLPPAVYALLAFGIALGTACIVAAAVVFWPETKGGKPSE